MKQGLSSDSDISLASQEIYRFNGTSLTYSYYKNKDFYTILRQLNPVQSVLP
jgi:hypothetical protein